MHEKYMISVKYSVVYRLYSAHVSDSVFDGMMHEQPFNPTQIETLLLSLGAYIHGEGRTLWRE
jgi:hypothetical protein